MHQKNLDAVRSILVCLGSAKLRFSCNGYAIIMKPLGPTYTSLDQPSKRARLDFAEDAPQSVPGRSASCTLTFPGENQRPPSCPQRGSGADQGDDWQVDHGPYGQPCNDSSCYGDSRHREPCRHAVPYYEDRRFEEHTPLRYGYQPLSPYRSSLYVPPRHQRASFLDIFKDVNAFQDVIRREVNKVSF
jgi:hypothetical protein